MDSRETGPSSSTLYRDASRRTALAAAALLLMSLLGCGGVRMASVQPVDSPEPPSILITNVSVFDGEAVVPQQDVLIRGNKIEAVGPVGTQPPGPNAVRIDGVGKTLLPGLVDSHVHFNSTGSPPWKMRFPDIPASARAFLYAGVTTVLVAQNNKDEDRFARKAAKDGLLTPHLYLAGPGLTAPEGHPIPLLRAFVPSPLEKMVVSSVPVATNAEQAREAVRSVAAEFHPPFFKIFYDRIPADAPQLSEEALRAAIAEAKDKGMRPIVHVGTAEGMVTAAEAGATLLVHCAYSDKLSEAQVKRLAELGVPFITTTQAFWSGWVKLEGQFTSFEREMIDPKVVEEWTTRPEGWDNPLLTDMVRKFPEFQDNLKHNVTALFAAGVPMFVGTDTGVPGVFSGAGLHTELAALSRMGIPSLDLLRAVTSRPAAFLDPQKSFGRVAAGQRADLLLVRGDPAADIAALDAIEEVFLEGTRLFRTRPIPQ